MNQQLMKAETAVRVLIALLWLLVMAAIVLLSVFGRTLQYRVADAIGYQGAAWVIGVLLTMAVLAWLYWFRRNRLPLPWLTLLWLVALFLVVPLFLERVEERLHFLVFGVFGVLTMLLFNPRLAIVICLLGSAGDELLQLYLPDRVGDWRDVAMNGLASLGGAYAVYIGLSAKRNAHKAI